MPNVTMEEFERRLSGHRGSLVAVLVTRTRPKLLAKSRDTKCPNPWPMGLERVATRPVMLGAVYENSVNLQREREGNEEPFSAVGLWRSKEWPDGAGERDGAYTVRHRGTGRRYFAVRPRGDDAGHAIVTEDRWEDVATGLAVDPADVAAFLPSVMASGRQDTERAVPWRTIDLGNVEQIRTFGEVFEIVRESAVFAVVDAA